MRFFLLLIFLISSPSVILGGPVSQRPYLIIISLDGFRWDYPHRGITPNLDIIAQKGVRALTLKPVFPSKTFPNHYSIATGLYSENHGIINNNFENPFTEKEYRIGDTSAVREDRWYQGETIWAAANRQGLKTASFFWPGSETHLDYKHPTYFQRYNASIAPEHRIEGVIAWLQLPENERPNLIFLYFSDTDDAGHQYGPDSEEMNQVIQGLDSKLGYFYDQLKKIKMAEVVNVIILSDHGMTKTDQDKVILLPEIFDSQIPEFSGSGPLIQFHVGDKTEKDRVYQQLKSREKNFRVYYREEFPRYYHYNHHPFLGDIIALADLGYSFIRDQDRLAKMSTPYSKGDHGYDNHALDMHGIFFARGPDFKEGYQTGTLLNIDLYPLACKLLGIMPSQLIDGSLERIGFILK